MTQIRVFLESLLYELHMSTKIHLTVKPMYCGGERLNFTVQIRVLLGIARTSRAPQLPNRGWRGSAIFLRNSER
jgi:hypothetical protein